MDTAKNRLLPISLIRQYTKTDDDFFVTDEELDLLRSAAFQEMAKYNKNVVLTGVRDVEQQVMLKTSKVGYIYDQIINLDYPATSPYVSVWFESSPSVNVKCAYKANFIYLVIGEQNICFNFCRPASPLAILYYQTGEKCPETLDASASLGCLRFIAAALNDRDSLKSSRSLVFSSGAYDLWK